jgi:hypothetical protein
LQTRCLTPGRRITSTVILGNTIAELFERHLLKHEVGKPAETGDMARVLDRRNLGIRPLRLVALVEPNGILRHVERLIARGCGIESCIDARDEAALAPLAARLADFSNTLFARVAIATNERPCVLPMRDGVALKLRLRAALGAGGPA